MIPIDVSPNDFKTVKQILSHHVPEYDVYAFGSRAKRTARKYSDLDLAVMTDKPLSPLRRAELKEALSESNLPFKVDIIDWADTKETFKKLIQISQIKIQSSKT